MNQFVFNEREPMMLSVSDLSVVLDVMKMAGSGVIGMGMVWIILYWQNKKKNGKNGNGNGNGTVKAMELLREEQQTVLLNKTLDNVAEIGQQLSMLETTCSSTQATVSQLIETQAEHRHEVMDFQKEIREDLKTDRDIMIRNDQRLNEHERRINQVERKVA